MTEMERARGVIDEVDGKMAELFERRMDAVAAVAAYKREHGLQIFDPAREEQNIQTNTARISNEAYRSYYVRFLRFLMDLSKSYQQELQADPTADSE